MEKDKRLIKLKPTVHQQLLDMAMKKDVAIGDVIEFLLEKWNDLQVFDSPPCSVCGRPMGHFTRVQALKLLESYSHGTCKLED